LKRTVVLVVIFLLFVNCAQSFKQKKNYLDSSITVPEICRQIEQNYWKLKSFKGRAHLTIESPTMGATAISYITYKSPDSLLIRVISGFGTGVATLLIAHNSFLVHSVMENKVYYGQVDSLNLSQIIDIDVKVKDLIAIFSGSVLISETENAKLTFDNGFYLVTTKNNEYTYKYWIDPKRFVVVQSQLCDNNDETIASQLFLSFHKERGVLLPSINKLDYAKKNQRMTLRYTERQINKKLKRSDFFVKIPETAEKIKL
jgi:outer membrane lipoprotein-sorting protein